MTALFLSWVKLTPSIFINFKKVFISATFGRLFMIVSFFAKIVQAIKGSAAFFAPEIYISPLSFWFPMIFK